MTLDLRSLPIYRNPDRAKWSDAFRDNVMRAYAATHAPDRRAYHERLWQLTEAAKWVGRDWRRIKREHRRFLKHGPALAEIMNRAPAFPMRRWGGWR